MPSDLAVDFAAEVFSARHYGFDAFDHFFRKGVLLYIARCSGGNGAVHHRVLVVGGEHQDLHVRICLVHLLAEINAVAIGHGNVQEQHVEVTEQKYRFYPVVYFNFEVSHMSVCGHKPTLIP